MTNSKSKNKKLTELIDEIDRVSNEHELDHEIRNILKESRDRLVLIRKSSKVIDFLFFLLIGLLFFIGGLWVNSTQKVDLFETLVKDKEAIINRLEKSDSLFSLYLNVDSTGYFYARKKNEKPVTYKDLERQIDSLSNIVKRQNIKLNLVKENYDIKVTQNDISKNGEKWIITKTESSKMDSALFLLEKFRDDIRYDKKTQSYSIDYLSIFHRYRINQSNP